MIVPEDRRYTTEHEWAQIHAGRVRVGITDYAQDALGDVVYVGLPEPGRSVAPGDIISEVESTKAVSEIYAPLAGRIMAVNTDLVDSPELLNSDPYGAGWICEMEVEAAGAIEALMEPAAYRDLIEG